MKRSILVSAVALAMLCAVVPVRGEVKGNAPLLQNRQPINVSSDRLEADDLAHRVKFIGHVVVRSGEASLYAQEVVVRYGEGRGDVEQIDAVGEVRIVQGERIATAERAVLYQQEGRVVLSGKAVLHQGQDVVQGDEVTVFLNEERSIIKGEGGGRVKAVFHPSEKTP